MDKEIAAFLITKIVELEAKHDAAKAAIGLLADKAGIPHEEIWAIIQDAEHKNFLKRRAKIGAIHPEIAAFLAPSHE